MQKRIVAVIGSYRKKETLKIVQDFELKLKNTDMVEFEYIILKDFNLQMCRGCFICLTKGEEFCPLKDDDREHIVNKIKEADAVVFATPNYSLQVTAIMKNFLDRIAYNFHRPCFFNKPLIPLITQGAIGGAKILNYFRDVAMFTGFVYVKGAAVTTVSPRTKNEQSLIDRKVANAVKRFSDALRAKSPAQPSIVQLAAFRMVRSMYRTTPDDTLKDVHYFRDNGWFKSDYYYSVKLNPIAKLFGILIDLLGKNLALKRQKDLNESQKKN